MTDRFHNQNPAHTRHGYVDVLRWAVIDRLLGRRKIQSPGRPAPQVPVDSKQLGELSGPPRVTWIGHASTLLHLGGATFLVDPVFSDRIGWFYRRHAVPAVRPEEVPPLVAVLITHNHYDHLDLPSLRAIGPDTEIVVPQGMSRWMRRQGFARTTELGWWESTELGGTRITLVPSRHWSRRGMRDMNDSLWGGFVLEHGDDAVYHAGDTAWFDEFVEIGRRFPDLLAALLPIGGYEPAWFMEKNHMNPEQAGRAFLDVGARRLVPIHWGTFQMTDEPLAEPIDRLRQWWKEQSPGGDRQLAVAAIGETIALR